MPERLQTVTEIENAWTLIETITAGNTIAVQIDANAVAAALNRMKTQALDGYDLFMVDSLFASGIDQVITDDSDFAQVPGITVFTANTNILRQAQRQGKRLQR